MTRVVLTSVSTCILILTSSSAFSLTSSSSPLAQLLSGIPIQDIQCEKNLILIIKLHNISPACIKPNSLTRFLKQNWILVSYNNTSSKGLLTGYVTFYPCRPVERPTDLPCTSNAHNYTVSIYHFDNKTVAGQTNSNMNGIYGIELVPGKYDIITQASMISQNITKSSLLNIEANRTTVFNVIIDSGIR